MVLRTAAARKNILDACVWFWRKKENRYKFKEDLEPSKLPSSIEES